jgi:drug/metabolite transporter (DMT)-like permease
MQASPLSFLAQYTFNISLALTNITSNTILSSTSSLFTFGLSVLLLHERFTARKLMCILACIAGTALVTLSDVEGTPAASPPPAAGSDKLNSTILIGASTAHDASPLTAASGPPTTEHHSLASPMLGDFLTVFSGVLHSMPHCLQDCQLMLMHLHVSLWPGFRCFEIASDLYTYIC